MILGVLALVRANSFTGFL